jgi:hypothetical protein
MNMSNIYGFLFRVQEDILSKADLEGPKVKVKSTVETLLGMEVFDDDIWRLVIRFAVNFFVIFTVIRLIYYPTPKRKDYLFTYFLISFIAFFICIALKNKDIDTGMALGLFAIFSIIRYRTDAIPIKEMTYLFVVIGISVINALIGKGSSFVSLMFINGVLIALVYGFERVWLLKHETTKIVIYEKIENIKPQNREALMTDLENRTGLKLNRVTIGKIDFLRDTAQIFIHYYEDEQHNTSNYAQTGSGDDGGDD